MSVETIFETIHNRRTGKTITRHTEFASDLGLAPGEWPTAIDVFGSRFEFSRFGRNIDGDIEAGYYVQANAGRPVLLTIYND